MPIDWEGRDNPRCRVVRSMPSEFCDTMPIAAYEYFAMKKPDVKPPFATNFGDQFLEGEENTRELRFPPARPVNHYDIVFLNFIFKQIIISI